MGIPKRGIAPLLFTFFIGGVFLFRSDIFNALRDRLIVADPLQASDAIYILAGIPDLEARTERAADVYRRGFAPLVLFIKDNTLGPWEPGFKRNLTFADRSRLILSRYGVPQDAVVALTADRKTPTRGTYGEAISARRFIRERNIRSIILVTSPLHTRRARRTFRNLLDDLSVRVLVVPATPETLDPDAVFSEKTGLESVAGGMIHYEGMKNIFLEYVKTAYYAVRFGWRKFFPE